AGMCERGALWRVRGGTGGAQKRKSKRRRRQQNLGSRGSRRAQSAWSDFAFYGICLLTSALSPTRRLKRMLTSCFQKIMGQHLIVHGSYQDHAPNAESDEHHRLLTRSTALQICLEDLNHGLSNLPIGHLDGFTAVSNVGR